MLTTPSARSAVKNEDEIALDDDDDDDNSDAGNGIAPATAQAAKTHAEATRWVCAYTRMLLFTTRSCALFDTPCELWDRA